ncbi:hypothetical protein TNCV_5136171 [Trichonephila clavipes]|nr:hypothetical protein TNCV_5136171 [Trichonephila clavipes]
MTRKRYNVLEYPRPLFFDSSLFFDVLRECFSSHVDPPSIVEIVTDEVFVSPGEVDEIYFRNVRRGQAPFDPWTGGCGSLVYTLYSLTRVFIQPAKLILQIMLEQCLKTREHHE